MMLPSLALMLIMFAVIIIAALSDMKSSDDKYFEKGFLKDVTFGKQLTKSLISVVNDVHVDDCVEECIRRQRCVSVNYKRRVMLCELNFNDTSTSEDNLISSPSAVYIEKKHMKKTGKNACSKEECELYEQCRKDKTRKFKCIVTDCGFPPKLKNADYHLSNGIGVHSKVEYTCRNNTCLDGKSYIGCEANGIWSPARFSCRDFCSLGWIQYEDSCYLLVKESKTWHNAQMFCEQNGSHLVEITSSLENDFIADNFQGRGTGIWLGGTDEREENTWIWSQSYLPVDSIYSNWYEGEPNNLNNEDCLSMWSAREKGKWFDSPCYYRKYFICERDGCRH